MNKFLVVLMVAVTSPYGSGVLAATLTNVVQGVVAALPTVNTANLVNNITSQLPAPLSGMPAVTSLLEFVSGKVGDPVSISIPRQSTPVRLGTDALPTIITCGVPIVKDVGCHICSIDCLLVHNTSGGTCTIDTSTPELTARGLVCVCQETRNTNGTISTPVQQSGPIFGPGLDDALDYGLKESLYIRESLLLCVPLGNGTYDNGGCSADCKSNHQYESGVCRQAPTIPKTASQTGNGDTGTGSYCICSY